MNPDQIKAKLISEDPEVLERCRALITEMLAVETARGNMAESRAATTLGAISVVTGLTVTIAGAIVNVDESTRWLLLVGYAAALAFLVRGGYFCLRTVSPQRRFIVTPDFIVDLQARSRIEGLRSEIATRMWQYEQDVGPNSAKLFWLGRGQRSLLVSVALLSLTGVLARLSAELPIVCPVWVAWLMGCVLTLLFFFFDRLVESARGWRMGRHYKVKA